MNKFRLLICFMYVIVLCVISTLTLSAQTYTDLYDFSFSAGNLQYPAVLAQGLDGNFYGTLPFAGVAGFGEIFRVTPTGQVTVLFSFNGSNGSYPDSGLTLGTDGNFYGSTYGGGALGFGTVFKISPSGALTTLHNFSGNPVQDGGNPYCFPIENVDGKFYGTTSLGTAYTVSSSGQFRLLTGSLPGLTVGPLILAQNGSFYGVSFNGGTTNQGTFFKVTRTGTVTTLYSFVQGVSGSNPYGPLVQGLDGSFYGTASTGGSYGGGTLFKLSPEGVATALYGFQLNTGDFPIAGPVFGNDGNLYGAGISGGTDFVGVLFQSSTSGFYTVLYNMDSIHGSDPAATPIQSTNGKFYGLTNPGGLLDGGVFYSLDVGLNPFISVVNTAGRVGKNVVILGQGFTVTTMVSFHGTSAAFRVLSDTALIAQVPAGATTGAVQVTTASGTLTSNRPFKILP